jgi:hypothetical protein
MPTSTNGRGELSGRFSICSIVFIWKLSKSKLNSTIPEFTRFSDPPVDVGCFLDIRSRSFFIQISYVAQPQCSFARFEAFWVLLSYYGKIATSAIEFWIQEGISDYPVGDIMRLSKDIGHPHAQC